MAPSQTQATEAEPEASRERSSQPGDRSPSHPTNAVLTTWFGEHRRFLWGLCYRITGSAADADDLVQDTYVRALEHGPDRLDNPRTWLTRVAVNAARDALRRRKRHPYASSWLPTPIETMGEKFVAAGRDGDGDERTIEARYGLIESVSLAFLHALEALTPTQRAVLLLRDVFDYSAAEVAAVLDVSEGNVRTIHHRARRVMESYQRHRVLPVSANRERTGEILARFLSLLEARDVAGIERMLAADVTAVADGGGEYTALQRPIVGRAMVAQFFVRLAASRQERPRITVRQVNGFPAAIVEFTTRVGQRPPRLVLSIEVDGAGSIAAFRVIAASAKLGAVAHV